MDEKKKEGLSIKEIEGYAKRHRFEIFYCLLFVFASLFTLVFWGAALSILLTGLGGILGVLFPHKVDMFAKKMFSFVFKQEKITQLVIGIAALIIAIFVAPLIFFVIGLHAGHCFANHSIERPHQ